MSFESAIGAAYVVVRGHISGNLPCAVSVFGQRPLVGNCLGSGSPVGEKGGVEACRIQ